MWLRSKTFESPELTAGASANAELDTNERADPDERRLFSASAAPSAKVPVT
jgi:hypothetical protein